VKRAVVAGSCLAAPLTGATASPRVRRGLRFERFLFMAHDALPAHKHPHVSARGAALPSSPIRKFKPYADAAQARGIKIFNLNIGQPDVPTPKVLLDAVHAFNEPVIAYGPSQGLEQYADKLIGYYDSIGLKFRRDHIIVTAGGSEALQMAMTVIGDVGDEVIIPEPFYTNYSSFAVIAGLSVVPVTCKAETGFHLPPRAEFEAKITPRTKAIVICSPNNPTGTVLTRDEMAMVVDLAVKHDLFIISDEAYREYIFDGAPWVSPLHFPEAHDRTILVDSISKRYSACGARLGCFVTYNPDVYAAALRYAMSRLCPPTIAQHMAMACLDVEKEWIEKVRADYKARRDIVIEGLRAIPGAVAQTPNGAFYVTAKLPVDDAEKLVMFMLEEFNDDGETVMMAPAAGFYATPGLGTDELRIAYVLEQPKMRRCMDILAKAVAAYNARR
jgi:aspartate aminotransferase